MAFAVLVLAMALEMIPMSTLAAVLVVGVRLVSIAHIRVFSRHRELPAYLVTAAGVVLMDLLLGVLAGMAVALLCALYRLAQCDVTVERCPPDTGTTPAGAAASSGAAAPSGTVVSSGTVVPSGGASDGALGDGLATPTEQWRVRITGTLLFLGVGRLVSTRPPGHPATRPPGRPATRPPGQHVTIDLHLDFLDHAAFEAIEGWRQAYQRQGGRVAVEEAHDTWFHRAVSGRLGGAKSLPRPLPRWVAAPGRNVLRPG